ncbi:hypothetical protein LWI29_013136 [Acer saccharum]|uniref:CCHC-type domain-containing protein n=1 Tax=Acer saccharum TaxID=4024 RepID=A0AA39T375_ACESA|nr:hypothetical protein LWI29_013136 [Acer saccharum]
MDFYEQHAYDEESEVRVVVCMHCGMVGHYMWSCPSRELDQAMNSYPLWPVNELYGNSNNQWSSYEPYDNTYNSEWRNHQDFSWSHNEVNAYEQQHVVVCSCALSFPIVSSACGRLFMCSVLPNSIKWRELLLLLRPIAPPKFSMLLLNFVISFVHRCFTSSLIYCSCTASPPSKRRNSIREDRADCLVLIAAH